MVLRIFNLRPQKFKYFSLNNKKKKVLQNVLNVISQAHSHCEFIDSSVLVDDVEYGVVICEVWFIIHCPSE